MVGPGPHCVLQLPALPIAWAYLAQEQDLEPRKLPREGGGPKSQGYQTHPYLIPQQLIPLFWELASVSSRDKRLGPGLVFLLPSSKQEIGVVGVVWRGAVLITPGPSTEMGYALPNPGSPDPASASTVAGICMCLTPGKRASRDQGPTSPWERRPESGRAQPPTPFPRGTVSSSSQCVTQVLGEVGLVG